MVYLTNKNISSVAFALSIVLILFDNLFNYYFKFWDILLFLVIITFGVLHGCFDIIIQKREERPKSNFHHLFYNGKILIYGLIWHFFPDFSFLLFLLISAWHFGETDLMVFNIKLPPIYNLVYGLGIIGWVMSSHLSDFLAGMNTLGFWRNLSLANGHNGQLLFLTNAISIICIWLVLIKGKMQAIDIVKTLIILIMLRLLPFNQAFIIYFGIWHSLHTLIFIKGDLGVAFDKNLKKVMLYLMASYLLIATSFFFLRFSNNVALNFTNNISSLNIILLIVISTLTLPHMFVMHTMFKRLRYWGTSLN